MQAQDVLDFWFGAPGSAEHGQTRGVWFRKDAAFDDEIRTRFGAVIEQALNGGLHEWDAAGARGTLARILVLDQFTRNAGRDTPAAFAGDAQALAATRALLAAGTDRELTALERWFAYLPLMHAEDPACQEQSVQLFSALAGADPALEGALDYAHRHRGVIARFGRFPHRNAILGRASTADESEYLRQPGSGF